MRAHLSAGILMVSLSVACQEEGTTGLVPVTSSAAPVPGRVVELSRSTGEIVRALEVGPDPLLAVAAADSVWTVNLDDSTISRIDARTGEVTAPDAGEVVGIASDGVDVWVASNGRHLAQLDGRTGELEKSFALADDALFEPRDAGFLVVGGGSVWMTVPSALGSGGSQSLWRIDPSTGEVVSTLAIGPNPLPPAIVGDEIWMATEDMVFERIEMRTERVSEIDLGPFPGPVAAGGGRIWAATAGTIHALDPKTAEERSSFEHQGDVRGLAWVDGRLWVATDTDVEVLDPRTGTVERSTELAQPSDDEGPIVLVPLGDSVWVSIETR